MTKPTVPDLKKLFKQAAEIAQQVPEAMQAAAFNRAVDLLTGGGTSQLQQTGPANQPANVAAARPSKKGRGELGTLDSLLESIDSTQHPGVRSTSTVLDRSLMVLQIARAEHDVDGLTPGDVARILTDKFRVSTSDAAVRMAFGNASNLVNRVPKGKGFVYRIMGPGEEHLTHLSQSDAGASKGKAPTRKRHRRAAKTKVAESTGAAAKSDSTNDPKGDRARKTAKRKGGASGPVVTLNELMESGFLEKHRTLMELIEHCRTNKAKAFRPDQLSGPLARAVRDGRLKRLKNNDGQYEYWK